MPEGWVVPAAHHGLLVGTQQVGLWDRSSSGKTETTDTCDCLLGDPGGGLSAVLLHSDQQERKALDPHDGSRTLGNLPNCLKSHPLICDMGVVIPFTGL